MILIILRKSADSVATTVLEADGRDLGKRFGYRSSCLWSDNVSARAVPSLHRLGHRRSAVLVAAAARPVTCRGHAATPSLHLPFRRPIVFGARRRLARLACRLGT